MKYIFSNHMIGNSIFVKLTLLLLFLLTWHTDDFRCETFFDLSEVLKWKEKNQFLPKFAYVSLFCNSFNETGNDPFQSLDNDIMGARLNNDNNIDGKETRIDNNKNNNNSSTISNITTTIYASVNEIITDLLKKNGGNQFLPSISQIDKIRVLAFSLHKSATPYPLIILTKCSSSSHPTLWKEVMMPLMSQLNVIVVPFLNDLGSQWKSHYHQNGSVTIKETQQKIPFNKIYHGLTDHQACQYNKLYTWYLDQFERLVFLDSDMLVVKNLDHLFEEGDFSGVPLVGESINTGLIVIEPNKNTASQLLNLYLKSPLAAQGEQGFLNWYFRESEFKKSVTELSCLYNLHPRNKKYAIWKTLQSSVSVWHFNGPVRPWDFWKSTLPDWDENLESTAFYEWVRTKHEVYDWLGLRKTFADPFEKPWKNPTRVSQICELISPKYSQKRHSDYNKFTVLIGTWDRIDLLPDIIANYQKCPLVARILITWHNPASRPPKNLTNIINENTKKSGKDAAPVQFLYQSNDSLNNRFNPVIQIDTQAVLVCDEDILINAQDLSFGFDIWKQNQNSLVGLFPRGTKSVYNSSSGLWQWKYLVSPRDADPEYSYSIILTKFMFMRTDYLFMYTCLLPYSIHHYVDQVMNCEDIAMSIMVAGLTGNRQLAFTVPIIDFGTTSGISAKSGHLDVRSQCLTDLIRLFGLNPLQNNIEVIERFLPAKFEDL